jgi:hypothetical protein
MASLTRSLICFSSASGSGLLASFAVLGDFLALIDHYRGRQALDGADRLLDVADGLVDLVVDRRVLAAC